MATSIRVVERRRRYHWPDAQLNFWIFIMLVASSTTLGIFANFMNIQSVLQLGIPWLFPYEVTVSALALAFLILILILISQRQLLPGIVILGTFILFVLWLTGLIETSIMLYGPSSSINANCNLYVNSMPVSGTGNVQAVLAYLEQRSICQSWSAAFAFEVVGTVFFLWMMVMAWQVQQNEYE